MSTTTDALEAEVTAIRAVEMRGTPRGRAAVDRHFARLQRLIAPRIRHFTRSYGLLDMAEDAAQACAIGLHRAILAYDPARARFTTFVNWQLRGELSALRFRMHPETREVARRVVSGLISLDALVAEAEPWLLEDPTALAVTEALAAETMARRACGSLLDDYFGHLRKGAMRQIERRATTRRAADSKPGTIDPRDLARIEAKLEMEQSIVSAHLLGDDERWLDGGLSAEQQRQIARRALRAISAQLQR
ncbi:MAG TPA: sigma factor [Novosphingobium sp.]|nr:sigma factor [Novosphingobium sp.]